MKDLEFRLQIDLRAFSEGLKTAVRLGQVAHKQLNEILSDVRVEVDERQFDEEIVALQAKLSGLKDEDIKIEADGKNAKKEADEVKAKADKAAKDRTFHFYLQGAKNILSTFRDITVVATGIKTVINGMVSMVGGWIEATKMQERAVRKVEQAISSTGMAAGFSTDELTRMASELQRLTTFGDEEILSSVTAPLLTFRNVSGDIFAEAQKTILDISTLFGGDLQSAAIQVGKALEDPIAGLSALRRIGISFSEAQQEVIKQLIATGDVAEAQALILAELNSQVGGQAEALAQLDSGKITQFKNSLGDLYEQIGGFAQHTLATAIVFLNDKLEESQKWILENDEAIRNFASNFGYAIAAAVDTAEDIVKAIGWIWKAVNELNINANGNILKTVAHLKGFGDFLISAAETWVDILSYPFITTVFTVKSTVEQIGKAWEELKQGHFAEAGKAIGNGFIEGLRNSIETGKADIEEGVTHIGNIFESVQQEVAAIDTASIEEIAKFFQKDFSVDKNGETREAIIGMSDGIEKITRLTEAQKRAIEEARREWKAFEEEIRASKLTETQKIKIEFEAQKANIEMTLSGDEAKQALEELNQWRIEKEEEIERQILEQKKAAQSEYYSAIKFEDENYYQYKLSLREQDLSDQVEKGLISLEQKQALMEKEKALLSQQYANFLEQQFNEHYEPELRMGEDAHILKLEAQERFLQKMLQNESLTEKQRNIIAKKASDTRKKIVELETKRQTEAALATMTVLGGLMNDAKGISKELFEVGKAFAIGQAVINVSQAITKALSAYPPPWSFVMAAAQAARGALEIAKIKAQKFATGGLVKGVKQFIQVNEEGAEYVINAKKTKVLKPFLDFLNFSPMPMVKQILNSINMPPLHLPVPHPSMAMYATGGAISATISQNELTMSNEQLAKNNKLLERICSIMENKNLSITIEGEFFDDVKVYQAAERGKLIEAALI